jgi:thioredoxin reductase (NADPH)
MSSLEFILYSRESCQPCHDFRARLDSLLQGYDYRCHVLDVDSDPELVRRYGARLPVLVAGGSEICAGAFDADAIRVYLENNRTPA